MPESRADGPGFFASLVTRGPAREPAREPARSRRRSKALAGCPARVVAERLPQGLRRPRRGLRFERVPAMGQGCQECQECRNDTKGCQSDREGAEGYHDTLAGPIGVRLPATKHRHKTASDGTETLNIGRLDLWGLIKYTIGNGTRLRATATSHRGGYHDIL